MERMSKEELVKLIESLGIDTEEYWILSSSALVLRDLFPDAGDLDIAVTEKGLEELKRKYQLIDKGNNWYTVSDKVECLLDIKEPWKIEKYGQYNLESIDKYLKYLETSTREKDKARIEIVKNYINNRGVKEIVYNEDNLNDDDITREVKRAKAIVVNPNDEIVLVYSHNNYFLLGGHVDEDESFDECIVREVLEESGFDIKPFDKKLVLNIMYYSKDYPSKGENTKYVSKYYVVNCDLKENLDSLNLTEDEVNGNFELRKISKNRVIEELENSLSTCTKVNVVKDTIEAIKEYLKCSK